MNQIYSSFLDNQKSIRVGRLGDSNNRRVLLYLPGTFGNSSFIETSEKYDLRIFLARRQIKVYSLDYRTHFLGTNLNSLRELTYSRYIEDVKKAIEFIKNDSGANKVILLGISRGATLAYFYAAKYWKKDLSGLCIVDGAFWWNNIKPTKSLTLNSALKIIKNMCSSDSSAYYGRYLSMVSIDFDKYALINTMDSNMLRKALLSPRKKSPFNGFKNIRDYYKWYFENSIGYSWKEKGITNLSEGYNNIIRVLKWALSLDRYWPLMHWAEELVLQDYQGKTKELDYLNGIEKVNISLLALFSEYYYSMREKLFAFNCIKTKNKRKIFFSGWGHKDLVFGNFAYKEVYPAVYEWIKKI